MDNESELPRTTPTVFTTESTGSASIPTGAFVKVGKTEREMKTFAFTEGELKTIGMFDTFLNIVVAIASAVLGSLLTDEPSNRRILVSMVVLVACVIAGIWAAKSRKSEVERVKGESRPIIDGG